MQYFVITYTTITLTSWRALDTLNPVTTCTTVETSHAVDSTSGSVDGPSEMDDIDSDFAEAISLATTPAISMQ